MSQNLYFTGCPCQIDVNFKSIYQLISEQTVLFCRLENELGRFRQLPVILHVENI